ncbi:MAG: hypothetical protein LPK07_02145 [Hymenobacteraceae bacterium]|nr:hypothetical protein [Hymenobacteraceae bacterium]MDX5480462.1 hypothetical protein [Hymenobacteraceae bacterium]
MTKTMNKSLTTACLLLPLTFGSCQSGTDEDKTIAATHPKLEKQLSRDSVSTPISSDRNPALYDQYRITMEEYETSGTYDVGDMYSGRLAPLDLSSHAEARTYRTALSRGLKQGVNFAGRYTVVTVGCGTSCQQHFVIDRQSGKIMDKLQSSVGASYSADSRLFIINPPDATIDYEECRYCTPEAYTFEDGKFRKLEIDTPQP